MDLDPYGADLSSESQLTLHPASGLDPTRQVVYPQGAATSIYPNVAGPLYASVETTEPVQKPPRALAVVPVVGENVATAQPQLAAPNPVRLTPAPPSYQPPVQVAQASPAPARPGYPPGAGQGLSGTDRLAIPPYQAGADSQEIQRRLLQTEAEKWEAYARNPWNNLMNAKEVQQATEYAAQQRGKINEIDKAQQQERDIQARAANSGLSVGPKATNDTIIEALVEKYRSGDPEAAASAASVLNARGHGALVEGYKAEAVAAMEGTLIARDKLQQRLDTAKTDADYNNIRDEIAKENKDPGFVVPKSLGEWEKQRSVRADAFRRAKVMIDQNRTLAAQQSDYTPIMDEKAAKVAASQATYSTNEPMHQVQGVQHKGNLTIGGQGQTGSHNIMEYGKKEGWNTYDGPAREEIEKRTEEVFPKTEREKSVNLGRAIAMATTDPKTGKPMDDAATEKLINTNPSVRQILIEGITAAARGGAGGTNGNLIKLELAKQGPVQRGLDDLITAFAGGKGVLTGKEGEYLSKLTQGQQRYVIDFLQKYNTANVAARMGDVAERAGMYGAKADQLPVEKEIQQALQGRVDIGVQREIQNMGRQHRVIGEDYSIFLGKGNAARQVPGAVRTPVPATSLPALYPELAAPPPAATTAPGGSGSKPPPGATSPLPQPGGGGSPFTGGTTAPIPFSPAQPQTPAAAPAADGGLRPLAATPAASLIQSLSPRPVQTAQVTLPPSWGVSTGATAPAPIAPTVPTPAAPGGPGTSAPPPPVAAPSGARGGGTFSQGTPSGGFPASINGNQTARTVYGTAGQTAQNVTNNPVIANNSAIVATSSAQSESSFDPNKSHDNKTGYGLFGHRLDRLTAMQQFAGTKPGDPIPPNVQTAFYTREMSKAADSDPFIAQTLRNPNATAEDLTRVQMRMERPQGYKGPGTEEQAHNWAGRLANTRALMAGGQPAAVAAQPAAAAPAPVAAAPQPTAGSLLNPRVALQSIQQKAAQVPAREVFQNAPNIAPAIGGVVGAATGAAVAGPPGAYAGGALGGAAGGAVKNYMMGTPEQQTPAGYAKEAGFGAAQGAVAGIPGLGAVPTIARIGLSGAVPGFEKYVEGKDAGEIWGASVWGAAGGAIGEGFSRALGAGGHALFSGYSDATQKELISVGKTLAQEQPKIMDAATGKLVENAVYTKAVDRAKQLHQDPDNLAHAWTTTEGMLAQGQIPPTKGEAFTQRPGQVGQVQAGRQLEEIKQEVAAAPKPAAAYAPQFKHDPVAIVGVHPDVPATKEFTRDAAIARDTMNRKANSWGEIWGNVTLARTNLLTKQREALGMQTQVGKDQAVKAYTAMADEVRSQQEVIARRLLPPAQADALMGRLEVASNNYRKAIMAGGEDVIATIAKGGAKGREVQAALNELTGKDPQAKAMIDALVRLHDKAKEGAKIGGSGVGGVLATLHVPVVGQAIGAGMAGYSMVKGLKFLNALWAARGAGSQVTFNDLTRQAMSRTAQARRAATGAVLGRAAGLPVGQAVGLAEPAQ